jgi:hypothetical protein
MFSSVHLWSLKARSEELMPSLSLTKNGTVDTVLDRQPWTHLFQHAGVSSLLLRKANTVL